MMDNTAIQEIQKAHTTESLNRELVGMTAIKEPLIGVPNDFKIQNLERYLPTPVRKRGRMETDSINDFTQFVIDHKNEHSACFVNTELMSASAILNYGSVKTPGHCDFVSSLTLTKTPDYIELININDTKKTQRALAEWIEEYSDILSFFDASDNEITIVKAITAVRNVKENASQETTSSVGNFNESRGVLAKASMETDNLPAFIKVDITAYNDLSPREFITRVSYHRETSTFSMRVIRIDKHKEEMAKEFAELVRNKITGINVYIGKAAPAS
jgi:uncharacterized protein YfdQ (DUF2303 family)